MNLNSFLRACEKAGCGKKSARIHFEKTASNEPACRSVVQFGTTRMSQQPFTSNALIDAVICLARKGRRVALDREPSRFAAGCLARSHRPFPERLGLPTRCGRDRPRSAPRRRFDMGWRKSVLCSTHVVRVAGQIPGSNRALVKRASRNSNRTIKTRLLWQKKSDSLELAVWVQTWRAE